MSRVTLLKGGDVRVYVNGGILCKVLSLKVSEVRKAYDILEYLSEEPVKRVPGKKEYALTLERALDGEEPLELENYTLSVRAGEREVLYSGCETEEKINGYTAEGAPTVTYKIRAESKKEVHSNGD